MNCTICKKKISNNYNTICPVNKLYIHIKCQREFLEKEYPALQNVLDN